VPSCSGPDNAFNASESVFAARLVLVDSAVPAANCCLLSIPLM
jgi:hypothetical protein